MTAHLRAVHGWGNTNPAGADARNSPALAGPQKLPLPAELQVGPTSVQSAAVAAAQVAAAAAAAAAAAQQISPRPTVNVN